MTTTTVKPATYENLAEAYVGSYYFIAGAGGDLAEWTNGYEDLLEKAGIGKPTQWLQANGAMINAFCGTEVRSPNDLFDPHLTCLLFPLEGLNVAKLAMFKLRMNDRWFDDVINNMRSIG